jgi:hypothetical protein
MRLIRRILNGWNQLGPVGTLVVVLTTLMLTALILVLGLKP